MNRLRFCLSGVLLPPESTLDDIGAPSEVEVRFKLNYVGLGLGVGGAQDTR
jgi:hypothetical protein